MISKYFSLISIILIFFFLFSSVLAIGENSDSTEVRVDPYNLTIETGESFSVDIYCIPNQPIKAYELKLSFDSSLIRVDEVIEGNIFNDYMTFFNPGIIDNEGGTIIDIFGLILGLEESSNPGIIVTINFSAELYTGDSDLELYDIGICTNMGYITTNVEDGSVTVKRQSNTPPPEEPEIPEQDPIPPEEPDTIPPEPIPQPSPPRPSSHSRPQNQEIQTDDYIENEEDDINNPPNIPITPSGPTLIEIGVVYNFSSSSFDIDGDQIRYKFDWGDGTFSNWSDYLDSEISISMSHYWSEISIYEVYVVAQDSEGLYSNWSQALNIEVSEIDRGTPPFVEFNISGNISVNETIMFDASSSFDSDGDIISYYWDFGDGHTASGVNPDHIYEQPGDYTVTLIVIDNEGLMYSKSNLVILAPTIKEKILIENLQESSFDISYYLIFFGIVILICLSFYKRKDLKFICLRYLKPLFLYLRISWIKKKVLILYTKIKGIILIIKSKITKRIIIKKDRFYPDLKIDFLRSNYDFNISEKVDNLILAKVRARPSLYYFGKKEILDELRTINIDDMVDNILITKIRESIDGMKY